MTPVLRCGEVARRCGVSPDTVRHYERLGLLAPARRTAAGYRQYPEEACRRVRIVRGALRLGLTLKELAGLLALRDQRGVPCREARRIAQRRLERVELEIRGLLDLRRRLKNVMKDWDRRLAQLRPGERAHLLERLIQEA